jgi:threonine dehydrogenase-like Zn-dependent dehydrogenase
MLAIILIVVGFMVMFRKKIDPKTELALPELNDEFVKSIGFENVEAFKTEITKNLQDDKAQKNSQKKRITGAGYIKAVLIDDGKRIYEKILIIGAGIIGLLWIIILHYFGKRNIVAIECDETRRKIATNLNLIDVEIAEKNVSNVDIIIDCSGFPEIIRQNINFLNNGGKLMLFGCCPKEKKMDIEPFLIYDKELTILSAKINPYTFRESVELIKNLYFSKYLNHDIGLSFYSIDDYQTAIDDLYNKKTTKAIFQFEKV